LRRLLHPLAAHPDNRRAAGVCRLLDHPERDKGRREGLLARVPLRRHPPWFAQQHMDDDGATVFASMKLRERQEPAPWCFPVAVAGTNDQHPVAAHPYTTW